MACADLCSAKPNRADRCSADRYSAGRYSAHDSSDATPSIRSHLCRTLARRRNQAASVIRASIGPAMTVSST